MSIVGDALLEVTRAYRVNYAIMGNSDQILHAHIVPRYLTEPDEFRQNSPWFYSQETIDATQFDFERDKDLMLKMSDAIRKRL